MIVTIRMFSSQAGIRESIAMTYKLEEIWKRGATTASRASVDVDQLENDILYRYVGTREGVYRVYPAIRVAVDFDPTKQPQYVLTHACNTEQSKQPVVSSDHDPLTHRNTDNTYTQIVRKSNFTQLRHLAICPGRKLYWVRRSYCNPEV